ncbi:protein singed [Sitodiplosis mosellana]|uniref:protein singed n=1 Tax=Sitodiplosis mosellana TaxID=263140 RepID=UPI0024439383|nr:protein singed [Sitodiplosis mosellana]XP_055303664.1 protein singed [Sitodiplosis mosellana]
MNGSSFEFIHTNGDMLSHNQQKGWWTIGLINGQHKYMTAETFGYKLNANGASLKKKQMWTLEPSSTGESIIYLRSHLGKYLSVDSFGNVLCESEERDAGSRFQISIAEDGSGRWALRNESRGYFLGGTPDKLTCTAKAPSNGEFWSVHLAARPQVNLRSIGRKRFAHLSESQDEIHVDANIPWGEDTLFTLEFRLDEGGRYALHTCNNRYLNSNGKLELYCTPECLFSAEYHSGHLALRDRHGSYLSPIGSKAVLKTRSQTVTRDELFSLEDSLPQASLVAALNLKYVSVKQGVDVTANQDEIGTDETFQLEYDWSARRWALRTTQDRYWCLSNGAGIQATGNRRCADALFEMVWHGDGSVSFRANNGKFLATKRSGHLFATSESIEDIAKFYFYLINRPILVLKCEQGFVGLRTHSTTKLECNKATYETILVERSAKGVVYFKGQNGKYWRLEGDGISVDGDAPRDGFYLELREPTRICIRSTSGRYLGATKNGTFKLLDEGRDSATHWEY